MSQHQYRLQVYFAFVLVPSSMHSWQLEVLLAKVAVAPTVAQAAAVAPVETVAATTDEQPLCSMVQ